MSFSQQIASFGAHASERIQTVRRGVTIKLFSAVIRDTPVLTGRLRANWQLTEGAPATGTVDNTAPSKGGLSVPEAEQVNKTTGDTSLYLSNNLPYAGRIEFEGFSGKAPEGMVRRNVARFGRLIKVEISSKT